MFEIKSTGSFKNVKALLAAIERRNFYSNIRSMAQEGVTALAEATPKESGITADSWEFKIEETPSTFSIHWYNTHENQGIPIAIILQYGHATGTGGYVEGRDYINPTMKPIFDRIAERVWAEVEKL